MAKSPDQNFSPEEAARRRDEVVRQMANTPPQHTKSRPRKEKKKKAGAGRAVRKTSASSERP